MQQGIDGDVCGFEFVGWDEGGPRRLASSDSRVKEAHCSLLDATGTHQKCPIVAMDFALSVSL